MSELDDIFLAGGLDDFPTSLETRSDYKTVSDPDFSAWTAFFADDRPTGQNVTEFPFVIFDAPLSRRALPYACKECTLGILLQIPRAESGAIGKNALRQRRAFLRFDTGQVKIEKPAHGSDLCQRLLDIGDDVVRVLDTDRQAHHVRASASRHLLLVA